MRGSLGVKHVDGTGISIWSEACERGWVRPKVGVWERSHLGFGIGNAADMRWA